MKIPLVILITTFTLVWAIDWAALFPKSVSKPLSKTDQPQGVSQQARVPNKLKKKQKPVPAKATKAKPSKSLKEQPETLQKNLKKYEQEDLEWEKQWKVGRQNIVKGEQYDRQKYGWIAKNARSPNTKWPEKKDGTFRHVVWNVADMKVPLKKKYLKRLGIAKNDAPRRWTQIGQSKADVFQLTEGKIPKKGEAGFDEYTEARKAFPYMASANYMKPTLARKALNKVWANKEVIILSKHPFVKDSKTVDYLPGQRSLLNIKIQHPENGPMHFSTFHGTFGTTKKAQNIRTKQYQVVKKRLDEAQEKNKIGAGDYNGELGDVNRVFSKTEYPGLPKGESSYWAQTAVDGSAGKWNLKNGDDSTLRSQQIGLSDHIPLIRDVNLQSS